MHVSILTCRSANATPVASSGSMRVARICSISVCNHARENMHTVSLSKPEKKLSLFRIHNCWQPRLGAAAQCVFHPLRGEVSRPRQAYPTTRERVMWSLGAYLLQHQTMALVRHEHDYPCHRHGGREQCSRMPPFCHRQQPKMLTLRET